MINETLKAKGIAKIQSYVTQNTDLLDDPIFSSESFPFLAFYLKKQIN
jgi:hypothetical protein